ncbi:MAG TPA: ABC transporter ATP-binding protein [Thermoplasmata archaeon]|nr:ABC transporter ATP-binding protein [Thermoplasmata archaeon]
MAQGTLPLDGHVPLAVRGLTVRYGEKLAVRGLTFEVRPGEVYGLLGSNGAGKSSTMRVIVGLLKPTAGSTQVFGLDPTVSPVQVKMRIGYVPENPLIFDALTPWEFLEFVTNVRGLDAAAVSERATAYAEALKVRAELDRPIATLSQGTKQKFLLVAALLHQPPLLVLDEPFNNLDPRSVRIMKDLIARYVDDGRRGVLFSTHTMEVAEQLCHRVGILDEGVLRGEGDLSSLRSQSARGEGASLEEVFLRMTDEEEGVRAAVQALGGK